MIRRILCALLLAAVGLLPASGTAVAHPLGNFTVNRLAQVDVAGDTLAIHYVLDQAEVPTMVDADAARSDPDGFAARRAARIADSLSLRIDGMPVALVVDDHRLSLPDGEAGLDTLRLVVRFVADVPASSPGTWHRAELEDANDPDRLGWREIVVAAHGTAEVSGSDVPADDLADGLRDYPERLLERPLDVRTASFSFQLGTETVPSRPLARDDDAGALGDQRGLAGWMTDQVTGSSWLVAAVGVAFVVGMFHALGPGHGKTMMAAYLLSTRGRARDALAIAVAVALMHSLSVLVLGAMMLQVGILTRPEVVFPWLSLASGVAVVAVGAHLCRQRFGERVLAGHAHGHAQAQGHGHDHSHAHSHAQSHGHGHGHSHGHGHDHSLPPGVSPLSWRGLLGLATAGGLLPSPSALVVLVGAVALGQVGFGFLMIGFFSIGLAVTLAAVGLLLVWARDAAERRMLRGRWILELAPRISAAALVVLGVAVVVDATMRLT